MISMKPNFIVIGAARSGTTSLFQYLDAHPEVYMSQVKELNFFSNEKYWNKGLEWYERNFKGATSQHKAIGEISPSYTKAPFTEDVVGRIHDYDPSMRLIYIVRSPIERCISHYLHRVQRGYETREFSEIVNDLSSSSSVAQGLYYDQVSRYLEKFSAEQIMIVPFDDLKFKTDETVKAIYEFIGVSSDFKSEDTDKVHNANHEIILKSKFGLALLNFYHQNIEQRNIPYTFKKIILNLSNLGGKKISKPKPSADSIEYKKLREFYEPDSIKLREHFNVNIDKWYKD